MMRRVTRRQLMAAAGVGAAGLYAAWPPRVTGRETPMLRYYYRVPRAAPRTIVSDVCVYGGTSAGIAAAVIARRLGRSVSVAAFGRHIGGLSASGLGATDTGRIAAIGGLSREFYRRVGERYGKPESFAFEPHVAEQVFEAWVAEHGIEVRPRAAAGHGPDERGPHRRAADGERAAVPRGDVHRRHATRATCSPAPASRGSPAARRNAPTARRSTACSSAPGTSSACPSTRT